MSRGLGDVYKRQITDNMSLGFWVQELSQKAIRVRDYLYGNTVATGKLCYEQTGVSSFSGDTLPF